MTPVFVWYWFNDSPLGETYGVRRLVGHRADVLCYTNRTKSGYDDAVTIAAAMNALPTGWRR